METFEIELYKLDELCRLAVGNASLALECIPDELKTAEICEIAVENDGNALEYVPEELNLELWNSCQMN